jgi:hypothetical protein
MYILIHLIINPLALGVYLLLQFSDVNAEHVAINHHRVDLLQPRHLVLLLLNLTLELSGRRVLAVVIPPQQLVVLPLFLVHV